ncbi:MAG: sigma-70 family RNA polymerase sigma factor [Actinomycetia bacterium]|nr:sigma-70 family RNA polymerase sigma factor [Actinomycetes bacterium]
MKQLNIERLAKLVAKTRADKEENFEQLYAELLPLVYYRALVLLNDRDEAQKVAQVCFVHIYKHIDELKNLDHFQPWLNAVITSACRGMLQARKHAHDINTGLGRDILADLLGGSEIYTPDEALEAHEADERTWAAIQALSQRQKEVILLYYIEGLSVDDIASVLGITYTAARSRLFKARRRLLLLLEEGEKAPVISSTGTDLSAALERMDAVIILPFLARQLAHFELSPSFGELGASIARLVPAHRSLLTVSSPIWSNVARELGLPVVAAATAPVIAGTTISAAQVSATAAQAKVLPGTTLKLIPRLFHQAAAAPAQAAVVGVASVALVAGVAVGGVTLVNRLAPESPAPAAQEQVEVTGTSQPSVEQPSPQQEATDQKQSEADPAIITDHDQAKPSPRRVAPERVAVLTPPAPTPKPKPGSGTKPPAVVPPSAEVTPTPSPGDNQQPGDHGHNHGHGGGSGTDPSLPGTPTVDPQTPTLPVIDPPVVNGPLLKGSLQARTKGLFSPGSA